MPKFYSERVSGLVWFSGLHVTIEKLSFDNKVIGTLFFLFVKNMNYSGDHGIGVKHFQRDPPPPLFFKTFLNFLSSEFIKFRVLFL